MRFNSQDAVAFLSLFLLTSAFPLNVPEQPRSNRVKRVKSYSVVNVDGGSTSSPPKVIETVTASADAAPTEVETVVATYVTPPSTNTIISTLTIVETQPPPTSIIKSFIPIYSHQSPSTPCPMPTTSCTMSTTPCSTPSISFTLAGSSTDSTQLPASPTSPTASQSIVTTEEPSVVTVVVTASEAVPTTEYYDDGMWHTRYPIRTFTTVWSNVETITPYSSASPVASVPSTIGPILEHYVGNGQWETLYPPPSTASASTPSIPFPNAVATST
ncbi:hypothetical protein AOQ84DRAFT_437685 [Glonium stellatum]|uniref:Uncharacterized protein n=1 Tax=Glonium stellatum TaxID=574774 RepID=A0A8E2F6J2_9PEZI|nr:hypothetical protein AOQ84DRAFT_437685 [Glonium stellatum]